MSAIEVDIWGDDEPRLTAVLDGCWSLLEGAVKQRDHGFRTPMVATTSSDFGPNLRTVVLRDVERGARRVRFHTDARSRKFAELLSDPRIAMVFYDAMENTQIRVQATARVHHGDQHTRAVWDEVGLYSRRCYLQSGPPGLPWAWPTSGLRPELEEHAPSEEESERGFVNFAVVECTISRMDWLYLSHAGHRRATFSWDEAGQLQTSWLVP